MIGFIRWLRRLNYVGLLVARLFTLSRVFSFLLDNCTCVPSVTERSVAHKVKCFLRGPTKNSGAFSRRAMTTNTSVRILLEDWIKVETGQLRSSKPQPVVGRSETGEFYQVNSNAMRRSFIEKQC